MTVRVKADEANLEVGIAKEESGSMVSTVVIELATGRLALNRAEILTLAKNRPVVDAGDSTSNLGLHQLTELS